MYISGRFPRSRGTPGHGHKRGQTAANISYVPSGLRAPLQFRKVNFGNLSYFGEDNTQSTRTCAHFKLAMPRCTDAAMADAGAAAAGATAADAVACC